MSGKWQVVLLVAIAVATPVASTLLFVFAPPTDKTTNRGELLDPVRVPADVLPEPDGRTWHLLVTGTPGCDGACRERLCVINQARQVNLGEIERIGRLWIVVGDGKVPASVETEPSCGRDLDAAALSTGMVDVLEGVTVVRRQATPDFLPGPGSERERGRHIYLVDPQGNLMMRHGGDAAVRDVAKDLGRLLRLSRRVG